MFSGATQKDLRSVISLMQSLNCLSVFLETLFELTGEDNDMALNLLHALLPSIKILKRNWKKYILVCNKKCPEEELELMKRRAMRKHTSMMKNVRFPLKLKAPPNITMDMVYKLLLNPSRKSMEVIFKYMNLTHPPLPQALVENLTTLVTAYCDDSSQENVKSDKIYTLDDIVDCLERDGVIVRKERNVSEDTIWTRSNIGLCLNLDVFTLHCPWDLRDENLRYCHPETELPSKPRDGGPSSFSPSVVRSCLSP